MKIIGEAIGRRWYSRPIPGFWQYRKNFELCKKFEKKLSYRIILKIKNSEN
jgi:hypothetical protein